jgi:hypothetical protein
MYDPQPHLMQALEAGDFESASSTANEYGASIKAALDAAPEAWNAETIFTSAIASLERALTVARVTRSHVAFRLAALQRESAYQAHATKPSRWVIDC